MTSASLEGNDSQRPPIKDELGQVTQQRKCKRYSKKRLEHKKQAADRPGDQSEKLKSLGEENIKQIHLISFADTVLMFHRIPLKQRI